MTASVTRTLAAGMPAQAATITALRLMACDFGLTPMSQQRLKPVPPPLAQNTFDDLMDADAP
jgi:hypothetical protein